MKIKKEIINYDPDRFVYWTRLHLTSDDGLKRTKIITAASSEYLSDFYQISGTDDITSKHLDSWIERVIQKWSKLRKDIFKNKIHYDSYVSNPKFESNLIDFLVKNIKA